jgi:hypothetical protein
MIFIGIFAPMPASEATLPKAWVSKGVNYAEYGGSKQGN